MSGRSFAVHPEHVQLSILISALVAPPPYEIGWGIGFDGPTAQRQLALLLLEEVQDSSSPTLTPLPRLLLRLEQQLGQAGAVLSGALVGSLRGLRSPDDMVTVFQGFSTLLAAPGSTPAAATDACSIAYVATTSPLGLFLRRVRLGLSGMSIQGLATLSGQIQEQLQQLDMQQAAAGGDGNTAAAAAAGVVDASRALKDQAVLEAYVNQLLSAVESQGPTFPASAVEAAIAKLALLQPQQPKLEYLRLAVSMAHKDMHAALASLHNYFDTNGSSLHGGAGSAAAAAGLAGGLGAAAAAAAGQAGGAAGAGAGGAKSKGRHQAALHSLAALHAHLGHPQEARAALQELLRLGQQHGDEWSLLHALAGLCRVLGMSEGLQTQGASSSSSSSSSRAAAAGAAANPAAAGWGLLDFRRTEQQLQLQALLRRCLSTARDMRAPHIAAFAAVALARFGLHHASSPSNASSGSGGEDLSAEAAAAAAADAAASGTGGSSSVGPAAAATSVMLQRMLLDVATLEHQAAIAAAAPGAPAVVAAAPVATAPGQQPVAPNLAARSTDLYNPSEAFGTGTSSTAPGSVSAAGPASKLQPPGLGWRAAAAAVSQALATAHLVAAGGLARQGASSLAGVRLLMLLTGPGGSGAAAAAAAAAAAGVGNSAAGPGAGPPVGQAGAAEPAAAAGPGVLKLASSASVTGCGVRFEDSTAAWGQLVELVTQLQGAAAGQFVLQLAQGHFPASSPPQHLAASQQLLMLQQALAVQDMPAARLACEELQCLAPSVQQLGLEVQLAAAKAHVQLHAAAGCWEEAHNAAAALFVSAASAAMQPQALEALMLMARASLKAGDAAGALPCALSALLHCQQLQLDGLLPEAVLLLAAAWQALEPGGSGFCVQLLQQVLPLAYASGAVKMQGELEEASAKAMLLTLQGQTAASTGQHQGQQQGQQGQGQEQLAEVVQRLSAAAASYEQAGWWGEAAGAWLALAHVLDAAGDAGRRNEAAARWHACKQKLWQAGKAEVVTVVA